jgi:hypothetical protein
MGRVLAQYYTQQQQPQQQPVSVVAIVVPIAVGVVLWTVGLFLYRHFRKNALARHFGVDRNDIYFECGVATWLISCCCFPPACICPVDDPKLEELEKLRAVARAPPSGETLSAMHAIRNEMGAIRMEIGAIRNEVVTTSNPLYNRPLVGPDAEHLGRSRAVALTALHVQAGNSLLSPSTCERFRNMDKDNDGFVSGGEARPFFLQSELPPEELAQIWASFPKVKPGYLNAQEFADMFEAVKAQKKAKQLQVQIHYINPFDAASE